MLYLFGADESLVATLPQDGFTNPRHREVLNGENTFQFSFPANQEEAKYIQEGNLVGFKDLDASWQVFEIKKITDVHAEDLIRTAYCEHIFYELIDDIVTDKRPSSSATAALAGMLENTRWQVGIVDDLGASSTTAYYVSALEAVQAVAEAWKSELQWRCIVTGGTIHRYVDLRAARGSDTGKQFVYSKDILSITRTVDTSNVYTAMYGRGKGVETESGEGYGRRLTFEDVTWTTPANPANKPAGQEWVGDPEALAQWGRPGGRHRYGVYTNEDQTDAAALLQETWDALQEQKTPSVTYELDVVSLERLSGYSHEAVRLGDLVRVIDWEFTPELVVSARVVEIERDLKEPLATNIILGNFYLTIVETTIDTQRQLNETKNKTYNTSWLDGKISVLQNEIENVSSYVFQTADDGILILDAPTFEQATKAMKLGGGIFALANSKTGSQWNWRTFGEGSGFTADEMITGILNAALVNIVSASGNVIIDGDGVKVYDATENLKVMLGRWLSETVQKHGIKIIDGEIYASKITTGLENDTGNFIKIEDTGDKGSIQFIGPNGYKSLELRFNSYGQGYIDFLNQATGDLVCRLTQSSDASYFDINPSGSTKLRLRNELIFYNNVGSDVMPSQTNTYQIGSSTYKWSLIRGQTITSGDLAFEEDCCAICGEKFADGDIVVLLVKTVDEMLGTLTIPIHDRCKGTVKTITMEAPATITKYQLNDQGEVEPYLDFDFDETDEEIITLQPNYEFKDTGEFFRKDTEENREIFSEEELRNGVRVTRKNALCTTTVHRKHMKYRTIEFTTGSII